MFQVGSYQAWVGLQVGDSDSRKEGIIAGDMKLVKEYEAKGKEGVMTKKNDTIDRNKKKIIWGYSILEAIVMILDLTVFELSHWKCLYSFEILFYVEIE